MNNNVYKPRTNRPWLDFTFFLLSIGGIAITAAAYYWLPDALAPAWILGVILYAGFSLPRWIGRRIAIDRAERSKRKEKAKWGFYSRDREGPWINYIDYPVVYKSEMASGKFFCSEWLIIHDGLIVVNPGPSTIHDDNCVSYDFSKRRTYAWDGCTPKRWFYWIALLGTPDWHRCMQQVKTLEADGNNHYQTPYKDVFWQLTDKASLIHDALYQYLDYIPLKKSQVDRLFYVMLREAMLIWPLAVVYYLAVRYLGGWKKRHKTDESLPEIKLKDFNIEYE